MIHIPHEGITYLTGGNGICERPFRPYNDSACALLAELSAVLQSAGFPEVVNFSFWCRKGRIAQLKESFGNSERRLGLGLAFHITPSNVPVNFAYSFVFGLLSGNANVVRVPSIPFPEVDLICGALGALLQKPEYRCISEATSLIRYDRGNEAVTGWLSSQCDARLIWGGDETIRSIRRFSVPERAVDLAFADRYSLCVMSPEAVAALDETGLLRLAEAFYRDAYLMDQNACSSPHLVIWIGARHGGAKERFWSTLNRIASLKYRLEPISAVDKYTMLCRDAIEIEGAKCEKSADNMVYRIALETLPDGMDARRGKCGYFYEYEADKLDVLVPIVNKKYQTLTYFGVDKMRIAETVLSARLSGIDRIVPVGMALEMDMVWDGMDVVKTLSRVIDVK